MEIENPKTTPPAQAGMVREWEQDMCACCGHGDSFGWKICCLTYWCPCYVWGDNGHRMSSARSVIKGILEFIGFFVVAYVLYAILNAVANNTGGSTFTLTSQNNQTITTNSAWVSAAVRQNQNELLGKSSIPYPAILVFVWIFLIVSIALSVVGRIIGYKRRQAMRQTLGIRGDQEGCNSTRYDCVAWFFCPVCVLCQEARTLRVNDVENGVSRRTQQAGGAMSHQGPPQGQGVYPWPNNAAGTAAPPDKQVMQQV